MPRVFSEFISAYRALVTASLYYIEIINRYVRKNRFFQAVRRSLLRQSTSGNELTQLVILCLWLALRGKTVAEDQRQDSRQNPIETIIISSR